MTITDEFIKAIEPNIPPLCTSSDLVKLGLFHSTQAASYARRVGQGPEFMKLSARNVLYPKEAIIKYLKSGETHEDNHPRKPHRPGKTKNLQAAG